MEIYKKGNLVKCIMEYAPGKPSEWTGKLAFIVECLEPDEFSPFIEENSKIGNIDPVLYNINAAKDIRYKVLIGNNLIYVNHLCFVKSKKILDWWTTKTENGFLYT